jgi:hypothetical protein
MNAELYVWYEALPEHEGQVQSGFAALLRIVQSSPDIEATLNASNSVDESRVARARLLKRADRVMRNDQLRDTWMEVWCVPGSLAPDVLVRLLEDACAQTGCSGLALGGRHVEHFVPQASSPD